LFPDYYSVYEGMASRDRYADAISESLLLKLSPMIKRAARTSLPPRYFLPRIYATNSEIKEHRDRPSCEISATVTTNRSSEEPWPISI
jgi:hypothetical protein